jgi:hypothetical protein
MAGGPARNALKAVRGNFRHLIYKSMITPSHPPTFYLYPTFSASIFIPASQLPIFFLFFTATQYGRG